MITIMSRNKNLSDPARGLRPTSAAGRTSEFLSMTNTNTRRSDLINWLNDAYAMERSLEVTLRKQAENEDVHRAVRDRARIHLDETEAHAERLAECLSMLDASPSTIKSATGQVMEMAKGMMTKMATDERVKDFLAAYGAEYFEVACYKALIAAANVADAEALVPLLEKNLKEDEAMAAWLDSNVNAVVRDYLFDAAPVPSAA
jgi:ferritin-like metal-binding protein YciE